MEKLSWIQHVAPKTKLFSFPIFRFWAYLMAFRHISLLFYFRLGLRSFAWRYDTPFGSCENTHLQSTNQRRAFQIWDTFAIDQSATSLPNLDMLKPRTSCELLSNWSIYIYYLCIIGQSKMNEGHDPTWNVCKC
jgi:hypothetical protein